MSSIPSSPTPSPRAAGVHLLGDFQGKSSLSQSSRDLVEVIQSLGIETELLDVGLSPERVDHSVGFVLTEPVAKAPASSLSIAHCNGDTMAYVAKRLPREIFDGRRIVGVWYWETESLPESHRRGFDYVDEVWVTSKFVCDSIARTSPVPVKHFPHLMRMPHVPETLVLPEVLRNDRYMFLFCFDYRSLARRKNPGAVCEAFIKAVPNVSAGGPLCVIKSVAGRSQFGIEHAALRLKYRDRPDIVFIDGWVSVEERDSLMARANCYISLHRAEGLGMTMLESMALGKPCIATNYSGNLEFMTPENSWLIPCKMVPVGLGVWPFPPEHTWAEADIDSAAAAMTEVMNNPALAAQKGELGRQTVIGQHSLEVVGKRVEELLAESFRGPIRPKPLSAVNGQEKGTAAGDAAEPEQSGRAAAYEFLKQAKAAEKNLRQAVKGIGSFGSKAKIVQSLDALSDIIRLQSKAHSETLRELGDLKKRMAGYSPDIYDTLVRDHQNMMDIVNALTDTAFLPTN